MLQHFKQRPQMYFCGPNDSISTAIYLDGYLSGLSQCLNRKLHSEIRLWYMRKNNIENSSLVWTGIVQNFNQEKSDEELRVLYVDAVIDFLTDNHIFKPDNNINKR